MTRLIKILSLRGSSLIKALFQNMSRFKSKYRAHRERAHCEILLNCISPSLTSHNKSIFRYTIISCQLFPWSWKDGKWSSMSCFDQNHCMNKSFYIALDLASVTLRNFSSRKNVLWCWYTWWHIISFAHLQNTLYDDL